MRLHCTLSLVAAVAVACADDDAASGGVGGLSTGSEATGGAGPSSSSGGGSTPSGLGRVFETTPDQGAPVDLPLTGLVDGASILDGASFRVRTCGPNDDCFETPSHFAIADANGNFFYDAILDPNDGHGPAAEVNAYHHLSLLAAKYAALGYDNDGIPIDVYVGFTDFELLAGATHIGETPTLLIGVFGDRNLAFDPDVFGHELGHLVAASTGTVGLDLALGPWGAEPAGTAIAEGSADYFSCSFMGDPDVGEYSAAGEDLPYLSSIDGDRVCPDDLVGEAHHDGLIWSGAMWDLRELLGEALVDQAHYDVIAQLPAAVTFPEATSLFLDQLSSSLTTAEFAEVFALLDGRGLVSCDPVRTLTLDGEGGSVFLNAAFEEVVTATELFIEPPELPTSIQFVVAPSTLAFTLSTTVPADEPFPVSLADATFFVRFGTPVATEWNGSTIDVTADLSGPADQPLLIAPAAAAGLDTYVLLMHAGPEGGYVEVSAAAAP